MKYYLYCEDMVGAVVGPFDTIEQAEDHIKFLDERGDADTGVIFSETHLEEYTERAAYVCTPQEDREANVD